MFKSASMRQQRHWPRGFCPRDLQGVRLFSAPLQRSTDAGCIGDPTFTRATDATYVDQDSGLVSYDWGGRTNRCLQSEDLGTTWTINGTTAIAADDTVAPDGTTTADKVTLVAASTDNLLQNVSGFPNDATVAASLWVKRVSTSGTFQVQNTAVGAEKFTIDLAAIGSDWVRVDATTTQTGVVKTGAWVANGSGVSGMLIGVASDANLEFYAWGAQLEDVDIPAAGSSTYTKTTTIAVAVPDQARFEAAGFLAGGARENLCLRAEELGNAAWSASNIAVADNDATAPDGNATAEKLTASAANGTLIQDLGVVASAAKTFSFWAKRDTGTGDFDCTLDGGSTWTTKTLTASWQRFTQTQTVADPDVGFRLVTDTDAAHVWGCQLEDSAAFASSYIPTTTVAVTRNADLLQFPFVKAAGDPITLYGQLDIPDGAAAAGSQYLMSINDNSGDNRVALSTFLTGGTNQLNAYIETGDAAQAQVFATTPAFDSTQRACAVAAATNDVEVFVDGVSKGTDTSASMPATTLLDVGTNVSETSHPFGHVRNVQIFSERLSSYDVARIR